MHLPDLEILGVTPLPTTRPQTPQTLFFVKRGSQAAWGPAVISNVFFGSVMVLIGVATLWQAYYLWKISHVRGRDVEADAAGVDQGDISNHDNVSNQGDQDQHGPRIALANLESSEATQSPAPHDSLPASQTATAQERPGEPFRQPEAPRTHALPAALSICQTMHAEPIEDPDGVEDDITRRPGIGLRADTDVTLVETAEEEDGKDKAKGTRDEESM